MRFNAFSLLIGAIAAIWNAFRPLTPAPTNISHRFYAISSLRTPADDLPRNRKITLLIAHPDDEAMFFAPTLLALTTPELQNTVSVLCLSSGDADGLGAVRKDELAASCAQLGVSTVHVVDRPDRLPDSMSITWPDTVVAEELATHAKDAEVLLTFDYGGVSGHPNHRSLLEGARAWRKDEEEKGMRAVAIWTLATVPVWRKYAGVLDAPVTAWTRRGGRAWVLVSGFAKVRMAQRAMTTAHKSQMRWFRWGWVGLSRYMVVNDLVEDAVAHR